MVDVVCRHRYSPAVSTLTVEILKMLALCVRALLEELSTG
jgi:hypothetical protein